MKKYLPLIFALTLLFLGEATVTHALSTLYPSQGGTGTATIPTYGQVLVGTAAGVYQPQATSTLGIVGGTGATVGTVSTSTTPSIGGLAYWTSTGYPSLLGTVATTSVTCSGTVSCSGFNVLGASPITLTGTGSTFAYPFPSNATTTLLNFNGNASTTQLTVSGNTYFTGATATTTISNALIVNNYLRTGITPNNNYCITASQNGVSCSEVWGNDNTTQGVQFGVGNTNPGGNAYTFMFMNNDKSADGLSDYYGGLGYTSGSYNATTFGTALNQPSQLQLLSSAGAVTIGSSGTTTGASYINFLTSNAGLNTFNTANERMRIDSNGNVGIGTTSPSATLAVATTSTRAVVIADQYNTTDVIVNTASTTGPILIVAATSSPSTTLFSVDQYGHLTASSTRATPTVSSCGTGSPAFGTNSNDVTGDITTGTAATSCTITFGSAYSVTPEVFVSGTNTVSFPAVTSKSTTGFTIGLGAAVTGDDISYWVVMP